MKKFLANSLLAAGIVMALTPNVLFADDVVAPGSAATPTVPANMTPQQQKAAAKAKKKQQRKANKQQQQQQNGGPNAQDTQLKDIPDPMDTNSD